MAVKVTDNSVQVKAKMSSAIRNALVESCAEVASYANRNVKLPNDAGKKLRGSYTSDINMTGDKGTVGTALEEGLWEEFGTGSHADTAKNGGVPGRPMWWVYVVNETPRATVPIYRTEAEAKAVAAALRANGKDAYASNGDPANYTLEKGFTTNKSKIEQNFARHIGTEMD